MARSVMGKGEEGVNSQPYCDRDVVRSEACEGRIDVYEHPVQIVIYVIRGDMRRQDTFCTATGGCVATATESDGDRITGLRWRLSRW